MRRALILLTVVAVVAGLVACGEDDSSTSGPTPTASGGEEGPSGPVGGAEEFVRGGEDNSIPTFGAEAEASEASEVEELLDRYLDAREAGDWKAVCSHLGGDATQKLHLIAKASSGKVRGCVEVIEALAGASPPAGRRNPLVSGIAALRVGGKEGFALFHGPQGIDYVMPIFREDGSWKVTEFAPIPYPLGTAAPTP